MYKIASEDFLQLPDYLIERIEKRIGPNLDIEIGTGLVSISHDEMLEILNYELRKATNSEVDFSMTRDSWSWKANGASNELSNLVWDKFKWFTLN